jgi:hypothetical protein
VQKYLTALTKKPDLDPDGFGDDRRSKAYEEGSDWEVPGWIKEIEE